MAANEKGFVQVGIWNTKVSNQYKSLLELLLFNLAIQPHLHKTDVTCRFLSVTHRFDL
jgi:hypothetical protein